MGQEGSPSRAGYLFDALPRGPRAAVAVLAHPHFGIAADRDGCGQAVVYQCLLPALLSYELS